MYFIEDQLHEILNNKSTLVNVSPINASSIYDVLQSLGVKSQDLEVVLEELLINAQEHGKGPIGFSYGKLMGTFTFVFYDTGEGIHVTIPKNQRLSDLKGKTSTSILRLALEEGVTGTGVVGRGMGLFYLSKLVSQKNAECLIASDSGVVVQKGNLFFEKTLATDLKRTIVVLQIKETEVC